MITDFDRSSYNSILSKRSNIVLFHNCLDKCDLYPTIDFLFGRICDEKLCEIYRKFVKFPTQAAWKHASVSQGTQDDVEDVRGHQSVDSHGRQVTAAASPPSALLCVNQLLCY